MVAQIIAQYHVDQTENYSIDKQKWKTKRYETTLTVCCVVAVVKPLQDYCSIILQK